MKSRALIFTYLDLFLKGKKRVTRVPAGNENLAPGSATGTRNNH